RSQSAEIILTSLTYRAWQLGVAYEIGMVVSEGGGAEDMVGMDVGQNHIADRQIRLVADRRPNRPSLRKAAARVDHGDRNCPDDKAYICDRVLVLGRSFLMHPV